MSRLLCPILALLLLGVWPTWCSTHPVPTNPSLEAVGNTPNRKGPPEGAAGPQQATTVVPGRTDGLDLTDEVLEELVTRVPPLKGFQNKTGMLPPEKWLPEFQRQRKAKRVEFFKSPGNGTEDFLLQPDRADSRCSVYLNHDYKFIWVRTLKTGSTSLLNGLGRHTRKPRAGQKSVRPGASRVGAWPRPVDGDPETWWRDYFVFSTVRNPYSRFASAYFYLEPRRCGKQTLGDSCQDPFMRALSRQEPSMECRSRRQYYNHIKEQTSCLFTKEGGLAVDFVAQTETMDEDFKTIAQEVNRRRRKGVPPMRDNLQKSVKANPEKGKKDSYASAFKEYPHCLKKLDTLLASEFEDLGYTSSQ